jgi:hypothetical protein
MELRLHRDLADRMRQKLAIVARVAALAFGLSFGAHTCARAETTVPFGPDLAANGWRLMTFPRRTATRFTAQGPGTLMINADRAVAVLWRQMTPAARNPVAAQWRWRVGKSVGPTDLSRKGGDDRAIAIHFVFSDTLEPSKSVDLAGVMRSGQAHFLVYVWGGDAPRGRLLPSPYIGDNAKAIVLKSAADPIGNWASERVDLSADYRRAFGTAAPALVALAISSDSDDTSGNNAAAIADLVVNP